MTRRCAQCNAALPLLARSCPTCGTANPARRVAFGTAAVLAVLGPAIGIAIYAATRWEQPLISGDQLADQALPSQPAAGADGDFAWLSAAMKACDDKAAREPNFLHLLVIPLAFDPKDVEQWRKLSLNRIGNALVLPGEDTLNGLRSKSLSIAAGQYVFSIRDERDQSVRKWEPATGVKWYSADADGIESLRMQYKPHDKGRDDSWGNAISHHKGICYWVNAIYEE
jgi:hypothetical protein